MTLDADRDAQDDHAAERADVARLHAPDPLIPADFRRALAKGYPLADVFDAITEAAA